jgi:hypothetical protein
MVTRLIEMPISPWDGKVVNGWEVALNCCDLRDIESALFTANQVSENQILIKMPSVPHAFRKEKTFAVADYSIEKAHGMTRTAIVGDKEDEVTERAVKYMILNFPHDEVLDPQPFLTQVIKRDDAEGDIECDFEPYDMTFQLKSGAENKITKKNEHTMNVGRVVWYVASKGTERRVTVVKAKVKKLTPADKLAMKLGGIKI